VAIAVVFQSRFATGFHSNQDLPGADKSVVSQALPFHCLSLLPSAESQARSPVAGPEGSATQATRVPAVVDEAWKSLLVPGPCTCWPGCS